MKASAKAQALFAADEDDAYFEGDNEGFEHASGYEEEYAEDEQE